MVNDLRISSDKVDELLAKHPDIPGSTSANLSHAACLWLRENDNLWAGWVEEARKAAHEACAEPSPAPGPVPPNPLSWLEGLLIGVGGLV
eukprot:SAG22_NODE_20207_length_267_cov_1.202381_1_plen_89_part_11